jgi:hypothetical protein
MTGYAMLAVVFVITCVALGLWDRGRAGGPWLAGLCAAVMVAAQFALLMTR